MNAASTKPEGVEMSSRAHLSYDESIERVADRLTAARPDLDPDEQALALTLLRALAKRAPVSESAHAASGTSEQTTHYALASWPGVFPDKDRRVVGFTGLSVFEFGEHRIELDGCALTAWCAWDTLFLPELLARIAWIRSRCPVTSKRARTRR
jgi:hypothetical protein